MKRKMILVSLMLIAMFVLPLSNKMPLIISVEIDNRSTILSEYEVHDPILIKSSGDFSSQMGFGHGKGTDADPYIIENLMIVGPYIDRAAIEIRCNARFIIRNCILYDAINMTSPTIGVLIESDYAVIEENIFVGDGWDSYGINLIESSNMTISNNEISDCGYGIRTGGGMEALSDSIISNNVISNCYEACISIQSGTRNTITTNTISDFPQIGIYYRGTDSIISGNFVYNGTAAVSIHGWDSAGMEIYSSGNVTVSNNIVSECCVGIDAYGNISDNTISKNRIGLMVHGNVSGNTIDKCPTGIYVLGQSIIFDNKISDCDDYGIHISERGDRSNITWNGFINNTVSVHNDANAVWFDYNYWSDYEGSDIDGNGIGDTPYENFFESIIDNHPLMYWPWYELDQSWSWILLIGGVCGIIALIIVIKRR